VAELAALLGREAGLAHGHYLLGAAQVCRKLHAEGLAAYRQAIRLDPRYRRDPRLLADAERLLRAPGARAAALEFLATEVGEPARDLLLRVASYASQRPIRHRAVELVSKLGWARQVDWLASFSQDLRDGPSCAARAEAVERLRRLRDSRAIPALRAARDERSGWLGRTYRNWCIRRELAAAIVELQSLAPAAPATPGRGNP
jgi:hypothetical protein